MKRNLYGIAALAAVLFLGYNLILNVYIKDALKTIDKNSRYGFCLSIIPDRITFFDVRMGENIRIKKLTVDVRVRNIIKKDIFRGLDGAVINGLSVMYTAEEMAKKDRPKIAPFVVPYFNYLKVKNSEIVYMDPAVFTEVKVSGISGQSRFVKNGAQSGHKVIFDGKGFFQGDYSQKTGIRFEFYPYYQNRLSVSLFGRGISAPELEPLLARANVAIEGGKIDFILQFKNEMRKVSFNNIMRFKNVKIKEKSDMDIKAVLGVSYSQMADFLKDADGVFDVNFAFDTPEAEFGSFPKIYASKFAEALSGRIALGIATAPIRQIHGIIWAITGIGNAGSDADVKSIYPEVK
ncbi:MAG TPA: hypothetical protein PLB12_08900 [Candidatus Goldiibacteriota bacterium]|nr:hypothetical protein [Candidatus Goldiibacteriota bacterium]HPN64260.1 hypothetical protein [Candidatus Goldiibacteriota bacterium]HRQ44455.1 hypothetical protein [Candidatus Goldiibacteriota bacterium]